MSPNMRRAAKLFFTLAAVALSASGLACVWFDVQVVAPAASKAHQALTLASQAERQPPPELTSLLRVADGRAGRSVIVRRLLAMPPSQVAGLRTLQRQVRELGTVALIGWHLDEREIMATRLTTAYMGPDTIGFERAAGAYFHTSLDHLSRDQLAELVARERVPTASAETHQRIQQSLLNRTP
jgi:hypothetical protein